MEPNKPWLFAKGNKVAVNRGPNQVSQRVKQAIVGFLENNVDEIQESFDKLKPAQKLEFIASILPYAAPKLSSVQTELSGQITNEWKITMNLNGHSAENRLSSPVGSLLPGQDS